MIEQKNFCIEPVIQPLERWSILKSNVFNMRVSKETGLIFEGSETECKKWIEENFKNVIEFNTNELFKTITFLIKE